MDYTLEGMGVFVFSLFWPFELVIIFSFTMVKIIFWTEPFIQAIYDKVRM